MIEGQGPLSSPFTRRVLRLLQSFASSFRADRVLGSGIPLTIFSWAEARVKIARMTLTIKLDGNWSSFQLANSAPPLSVTDSAIRVSNRYYHNLP